jgi:hypothetical protein
MCGRSVTSFELTQDMVRIIPPTHGVIAVINVVGHPACTYVLPRSFIKYNLLDADNHKQKKIYLPVQPSGGRRADRDYSKYKNAWHLAE